MIEIKCDIIIPVWNELEFIRKCVESIEKNTSGYKIILVDNASDKETASYLRGISEKDKARIMLIRNEENLGFPKAVNQGIAVSSAPYVCVLNSDTEVYKNWLSEMINIGEANPDIGVLNPASNNLGCPGQLEGFSGKWVEMASCIGFCMLIKREVIQKIGSFDEIYSPGNFEDTDFCRRAVKAGYKCVMAKGAYVYHKQNTGFKKRKDWDERFEKNKNIFNERWGKIKRIAYVVEKDAPESLGEDIKNSLKNGDWAYVYLKKGVKFPQIQEHGSLRIIQMSGFMFTLKVWWNISLRKKRFDGVMIPSSRK